MVKLGRGSSSRTGPLYAALLVFGGFALGWAAPALSATPQNSEVERIAAIVNDQIISEYDLQLRLKLVEAVTRVPESPADLKRMHEQVLRNMVDEKLQLQEAKKKEVTVSDKEIQDAVLELGRQNNMPDDQFAQFLTSLGPSRTSLADQLHAELAWNKLLRRTIRVDVGDEEVQTVLDRLKANAGQFEYLISEIFLIVDNPTKNEEVRQTAERLVNQVRDGTPFQGIARQFSESATAANGGMVGWVQQGQMDQEVESEVTKMRVNTVSDPIKTAGGYYLVNLLDRRRILSADPRDTQFKLMQITMPIAQGTAPDRVSSMRTGLASIANSIKSCDQVPQVAESIDQGRYADVGTLRAGDLPEDLQSVVLGLQSGQASAPIQSNDMFRVLVACDRKEPEFRMPSPDEIENNLFNQRLSMLARRYLRDLRRDAVVDYK
jgi:peptidyl-prolyl cis-trans isomerase SurA